MFCVIWDYEYRFYLLKNFCLDVVRSIDYRVDVKRNIKFEKEDIFSL